MLQQYEISLVQLLYLLGSIMTRHLRLVVCFPSRFALRFQRDYPSNCEEILLSVNPAFAPPYASHPIFRASVGVMNVHPSNKEKNAFYKVIYHNEKRIKLNEAVAGTRRLV